MPKYVGIKNNNIQIISDKKFDCSDFALIELPSELISISADKLISDYKIIDGKVVQRHPRKPAKELKVALVGNWMQKCGISTYNFFLWQKVIKHLGQFKLFIEKNDTPIASIYQLDEMTLAPNQVSECWKRGESLQQLVDEIKAYQPDLIWVDHEYGLFPNARYFLSMMSQLSEFRVITTMHSVFHHQDKTICEAAMPEIITHLEGGKKLLKEEKKISGKVYVIPHGCDVNDNKRLWNFYKSEHTIIQMGFLFKYKCWEKAIKTISILKEKYNDVFFTGICSESPYSKSEHQAYYNELVELIEQLGIKENVALIRGFQSDEVLDSYLRTNRVALFPYVSNPLHEVWGASGASRLAMSRGLPVISSSIHHFSDLPTIKANSAEEMASEIDKIFSNKKLYQAQLALQNKFLEENSWEKIALKHIEIFENP